MELRLLVFDVFLGLMEDAPLRPAGSVELGAQTIKRLVGGQMLPGRRKETTLVFEVYEGEKRVERIEETSLVGVSCREEIHQHLHSAGFEVTAEWSGYNFIPYQEGDPLLILTAVKKRKG